MQVNRYEITVSNSNRSVRLAYWLCETCANKEGHDPELIKPGKPRQKCDFCLNIYIEPYPYAALPHQVEDAWKHVGPGEYDDEPDLPATHDEDDFLAAIDRIETDWLTYSYHLDKMSILTGEELLDVWQTYAEEGHYIRPDVLAAATAQTVERHLDSIKADLAEYLLGDWSSELDENLRSVTYRLTKKAKERENSPPRLEEADHE